MHSIFYSTLLCVIITRVAYTQPVTSITDLNPATAHSFPEGFFFSAPIHLTTLGNKLLFAANDGIHGNELWTSDGTPSGAILLKDIKPGAGSSNISGFTNFNDKIYFAADNGTSGLELWVTDGTPEGTVQLKDLRPGAGDSTPRYLTLANNLLFFAADQPGSIPALWQSDGTPEGTITTPGLSFSGLGPSQLTALDGKLYFAGPDRELWVTDGSAGGAFRVKEISPTASNSYIEEMVALDGKLYFSADDEPSNSEPWVSDGTEAGTFKLREIEPGVFSGSNPRKFHEFKNRVWFSASGLLWTTDGTPDGTDMFKNLSVFPASNDPACFFSDSARLYFPADDGQTGYELWSTDGTPAGTDLVKNINPNVSSSYPEELTAGAGGLLYFRAYTGSDGWELWQSDGTTSGTTRVADIRPGPESSYPQAFTRLDNALYFVADDGILGRELWKLDLSTGLPAPLGSDRLFSLSPNPANTFVHLYLTPPASEARCSLRLFDMAGQMVYAAENITSETWPVPVGHLSAGMYSLVLVSEQRVQSTRVAVTH